MSKLSVKGDDGAHLFILQVDGSGAGQDDQQIAHIISHNRLPHPVDVEGVDPVTKVGEDWKPESTKVFTTNNLVIQVTHIGSYSSQAEAGQEAEKRYPEVTMIYSED